MRENRKLVTNLSGIEMEKAAGGRAFRACAPRRERDYSESLILAQNERWQRGLGMQVERDLGGSNTF